MLRSLGRGGLVWEGRSQECPFVGSPRLQNWTPRKSHTYTDAAHHNDDDVDIYIMMQCLSVCHEK